MPRQPRLDYPGALHHVIGRGIDGLYIFKETKDKKEFLKRVQERLAESSLQIYAWCLMDNHFHFLIQTGKTPLPEFMRSILTGYAIYYNKKHKRRGHLFQNRYKSILCEDDAYLLKLISYVHLNPVKAKVVKSIGGLKEYVWTGHKELMAPQEEGLLDRDEVLGLFGGIEKQAIGTYVGYLKKELRSNEDLMGGGLVRSLGGFGEAIKIKGSERQVYDERILGSGKFVEEVLGRLEAGEDQERVFKSEDDLLRRLAQHYKVEIDEIVQTRNKRVREARNVLVYLGYAHLNKSITEMGSLLKIKESAASQARQKGQAVVRDQNMVGKLKKIKL